MSYNYAEQILFQAVHLLVTGLEPIRGRLAGAAQYVIRLDQDKFPDRETAQIWQGIRDDLTFQQPGHHGEGAIDATTRNLSDHDATQVANQLLLLYQKILKANAAAK